MSRIANAERSLKKLDELARQDTWLNRVHPLVKLLVTILYLVLVVSFQPRQLTGVLGMALYPFLLFEISGLSFKDALYRLRVVLPVVCMVGILNPFFDREVLVTVGRVPITGGVMSMLTLMVKAVLTVLAGYLLIATTPIEEICRAMRVIHIPKVFVIVVLLIYRYVTVLLSEARRITQAYQLRAPRQKGVHYKVWGPLLGQMLLRSMDRANDLYDSMQLRGFDGDFHTGRKKKLKPADFLWPMIWMLIILALRLFPVVELLGSLFVQ